jgi:hypothetical protein
MGERKSLLSCQSSDLRHLVLKNQSDHREVAMKELIEQIAKALVDNPDQVSESS